LERASRSNDKEPLLPPQFMVEHAAPPRTSDATPPVRSFATPTCVALTSLCSKW